MVMLVDLYNYRATAEFQNYINRTERRERLSKIPNRKNHMEHRLTLFSSPCIKFRAFRQLRPAACTRFPPSCVLLEVSQKSEVLMIKAFFIIN